MYKKIVLIAFEKAQNELAGKTNKTRLAIYISEILMDDYHNQISERQLRNLYNRSLECSNSEDISISSLHVQYLCDFLGYKKYADFLKENSLEYNTPSKSIIKLIKSPKSVIIMCSLSFFLFSITISINQQRWLIWENSIARKYILVLKGLI
jgi:hypothetical protein